VFLRPGVALETQLQGPIQLMWRIWMAPAGSGSIRIAARLTQVRLAPRLRRMLR